LTTHKPVDARFPAHAWRRGRPLARIHRAGQSPWWFSADGTGRFDPVGVADSGACCLAPDELGAFVEVFRTPTTIAADDIEARRLSVVRLGRELRLADLCSRRALTYGVTAELGAGGDYDSSQQFALEACDAGFDGVRWWVRHDPAQRLVGVAVFGPAGEPDPSRRWPVPKPQKISERLLARARRDFGYQVVPRP
jgi:hypothetical protein